MACPRFVDEPGSWAALNSGTWTTVSNGNSATCYADDSISGALTVANVLRVE